MNYKNNICIAYLKHYRCLVWRVKFKCLLCSFLKQIWQLFACTIMFVVWYRNVNLNQELRNRINDHKKNHANNNNDNNNNNDDNNIITQNLRTFFDDFTQLNALEATVDLYSVSHPCIVSSVVSSRKRCNKICSKKYYQTRKM